MCTRWRHAEQQAPLEAERDAAQAAVSEARDEASPDASASADAQAELVGDEVSGAEHAVGDQMLDVPMDYAAGMEDLDLDEVGRQGRFSALLGRPAARVPMRCDPSSSSFARLARA